MSVLDGSFPRVWARCVPMVPWMLMTPARFSISSRVVMSL